MSALDAMTVEAPAKINLFLRVVGRRDDGYHDIESLLVPVSLFDRLDVHAHADPTAFRTLALSLEVRGAADITRGVPADESNLVLRAARVLAERAGVRGFADFDLEKRIPAAAGLGGGSTDAAAALRALDSLWTTEMPREDLAAVAAEVGSDVAALLTNRPVFVSGRGERVQEASPVSFALEVVTFGFGVRTSDAYRWWDEDGGPAANPGAQVAGHPVFNDLEDPVMRRHPQIREARNLLLEGGAAAAIMCGSGPSVAAILPEGAEALDPAVDLSLQRLGSKRRLYAHAVDMRS